MNDSVLYVYGVVRDGFDPSRAPAGLDDTVVSVVTSGRIAALASRLPAGAYGAAVIEERSGDVGWLSPRAMAHDRVLTWAQEHGGVIPLPMFSMWGSDAALTSSLAGQTARLEQIFERVSGADEFGLRVHRRDAAMLDAIDEIDPEIAQLRREAAAASPGQRYLLDRKIADMSKASARVASHRMAKEVFQTLRRIARDAVARPLAPEAGRAPDATLVLNGAFLVDAERLDAFRAAVGEQVRAFQARGLSFDFTGPWPPYNFVGAADSAAALRSEGSRDD